MEMLDCHCHIDRYEDPTAVAREASQRGVLTVAMTNLPSHFRIGLPHVKSVPRLRLGLGLHPLCAEEHEAERALFAQFLNRTSFVGEVGLDFSQHAAATSDVQIASFRFVAGKLCGNPKVVSLHSRGAESAVLDILQEFEIAPAIFHWYSGPLPVIDRILESGHFFSVNPAMVRSKKGQAIIDRLPPHRVLSETDGPYVKHGRQPVKPWDVERVEAHLDTAWNVGAGKARKQIWKNFRDVLFQLGLNESR